MPPYMSMVPKGTPFFQRPKGSCSRCWKRLPCADATRRADDAARGAGRDAAEKEGDRTLQQEVRVPPNSGNP